MSTRFLDWRAELVLLSVCGALFLSPFGRCMAAVTVGRSVAEIKADMARNHHLPDIPSESEVKEKGIGIGDMQTKLRAKIEEPTLHLNQAEERNNRLQRQVVSLSERLSRMNPSGNGKEASLQWGGSEK